MSDSSKKERMLDLLTDEVLFGLDEKERNELRELERLFPELRNDNSLELTVGALGFSNLRIEPLPDHLHDKILASANNFFAQAKTSNVLPFESTKSKAEVKETGDDVQKTFSFEPKRPWTQWLGWAFAGLACLALAFSVWTNLQKPKVVEIVKEVPPRVKPPLEQYNELVSSAKDLKKSVWVNPKNEQETLGEVVWSDAEQKGFMKFKGLTANDTAKETYQLWIFDETQSDKTPIDGGVFDVTESGEVLVPINAKLKVKNPKLFAVTVEKTGGVVVSSREKIAAIAKVSA